MSPSDGEIPFIYRMGLAGAERAGRIARTGNVGAINVYISRRLLEAGFSDKKMREDMIERGLELLRRPDPGDDSYAKIRFLDVYDVWVIRTEEGIAYLNYAEL